MPIEQERAPAGFTCVHVCERSEQFSAYIRFRGLQFQNKHVQMFLQIQIEILAERKHKLPTRCAEHRLTLHNFAWT
jgi:hypothetical protein